MPESRSVTQHPAPSVRPDEAAERPGATPRSFRSVYDGHFDFVWRFAMSCGVPQASLDDVVQRVFVLVHAKLSGLEEPSALRTGIASVARLVVQGHLRKRAQQAPKEPPPLRDEPSAADELLGGGEALHDKSAGQLLDIVLNKLSETQRDAFILRDMEGLSMAETAEILSVNENTLRVWLHDARTLFNSASALWRAQRFWVTREGGRPP